MNRLTGAVLLAALAAGAIVAALVASRDPAPQPSIGPRVELLDVRTEDWTPPGGKPRMMVYANWKNTGDRPVRAVMATVRLIGRDGKPAFEAKGVLIYVAPADSPGVALGDEYHEPDGLDVERAILAEVEITGATG